MAAQRRKYRSPERCSPVERQQLIDTAAAAYLPRDPKGTRPSLASIGQAMSLSAPTVRRLLITAGVYHSPQVDHVHQLYRAGCTTEDIMSQTGLTRAAISACMPYGQLPALSAAPDPQDGPPLIPPPDEAALWETLTALAGTTFRTAKGLDFTYSIRGNEMFVDRKGKSITRATIELAFRKAVELGPQATGPKKLGCFGASYLYPIFIRLGVIPLAGRMSLPGAE